MNKPKRAFKLMCLFLCACMALLASCAPVDGELKDGYYTAEAAAFDDYGWKEFITICVSDHQIVSVDYDAKNASGMVKSWDMEYMRLMNAVDGTYPNEYVRIYSQGLLDKKTPSGVDAISGATHSHRTFVKLAEAAIEQAKTGNTSVVFVNFAD